MFGPRVERRLVAGCLVLLLFPAAARATWSIVAVDAETREVAVGAATCTLGVEWLRGLAPGRGAIAAQAATSLTARNAGRDLLASGADARAALTGAEDAHREGRALWDRPWSEQQVAVASLDPTPATVAHTGERTVAWSGARSEADVTVQGNMLRGPSVVDDALAAFRVDAPRSDGCPPGLVERILRGLEAGAAAGGDVRCSAERGSLSAFVALARPDDDPEHPSLFWVAPQRTGFLGILRHAVFPREPGASAPSPVVTLRRRWQAWLDARPTGEACTSVPER